MKAKEGIQKNLEEYIKATNNGDMEAMAATMMKDIVYIAPDCKPMRSIDQVKRWAKDSFFDPFNVKFNAEFENLEVFGDRAYAPGSFQLDLTPKKGGEKIHLTGEFFDIFQQAGDEWKLKHCIYNYDQPVPAESQEERHQAGVTL